MGLPRGGGIDLVVDVGDVAQVRHVGIVHAQQPEQDVEHHRRAAVADVHPGIDRGPADVHGHPIVVQGLEAFLACAFSVVKLKVHELLR